MLLTEWQMAAHLAAAPGRPGTRPVTVSALLTAEGEAGRTSEEAVSDLPSIPRSLGVGGQLVRRAGVGGARRMN
ncbi:hypothetical protein [Streptomyces sp. NRRL S-237]|uniref:hypothetical protein n=1 Tax=Streptomyces sp. NRRL S-237 TaxID=1463895 RepID=UPI000AD97755|nr:hypothetical protein [Streptomyces sp. NRRL S-237]